MRKGIAASGLGDQVGSGGAACSSGQNTDTPDLDSGNGRSNTAPVATIPRRRGGFENQDKDKLREGCRRGALAGHARGTSHKFTSKTGRAAGRKGGYAQLAKGLDYMRAMGIKGGEVSKAMPRVIIIERDPVPRV